MSKKSLAFQTDRPTDRQTDRVGCRVACTRLKRQKDSEEKKSSSGQILELPDPFFSLSKMIGI